MSTTENSQQQSISASVLTRPRLVPFTAPAAQACVYESSLLPIRRSFAPDGGNGFDTGAMPAVAAANTKDARPGARAWSPPIT